MTEGSDMKFSHTEESVGSWCVRIPHTRLRVLRNHFFRERFDGIQKEEYSDTRNRGSFTTVLFEIGYAKRLPRKIV